MGNNIHREVISSSWQLNPMYAAENGSSGIKKSQLANYTKKMMVNKEFLEF